MSGVIFTEADQKYRVGGVEYPRVSDIIRAAGLVSFDSIPPEIMARAQARGSAVHLATQFYDEGSLDWKSVDKRIEGYVQGYIKFRKDTADRVKILEIERPHYHPFLKFAGRVDRTIYFDENIAVLDIKTPKGDTPATRIQTAGYVILLEGDETIINPQGDRDIRRFELKLNESGGYKLTEYDDLVGDKAIFFACMSIYQWKQKYKGE